MFVSGDYAKYGFFDAQEWASMEKRAAEINCVQESYTLDKIETFILEGYAYDDICCAKPGDIVLDCGAYTGNTALYFSQKVGAAGRVYSFEAMPQTFKLLTDNVKSLGLQNVYCEQYALSDKTEDIYFTDSPSPGSRKLNSNDGIKVRGIAIDDFAAANTLNEVNFIKMDIEGSEAAALQGAKNTIRKFKPDLAICVYHKHDDFLVIPAVINKILPFYDFYLKHNSINFWGTVLFCKYNPAYQEKLVILPDESTFDVLCLLWKLLKNSKVNHALNFKKYFLQSCDTFLKAKNIMPCAAVYEKTNYNFSFYPLSSDQRLHYEFYFNNNRLEICLHFEGKYLKEQDTIKEIASQSKLQLPLNINKGILGGVSYHIPINSEVEYAVDLMSYLVDISFPILLEKRLLADNIIFARH